MRCDITYTETEKSSVSQEEHSCALLAQHCGYNSSSFLCLFLIKPSTLPSHYSSGRFLTDCLNKKTKQRYYSLSHSLCALCACAYMEPPPTGKWTALTGKSCVSGLLSKAVDDTLAVS